MWFCPLLKQKEPEFLFLKSVIILKTDLNKKKSKITSAAETNKEVRSFFGLKLTVKEQTVKVLAILLECLSFEVLLSVS